MTEAQRKAYEKYRQSPKGRAARRRAQDRYNQSGKGKMARRRYNQSCKGKENAKAVRNRGRCLKNPQVDIYEQLE